MTQLETHCWDAEPIRGGEYVEALHREECDEICPPLAELLAKHEQSDTSWMAEWLHDDGDPASRD